MKRLSLHVAAGGLLLGLAGLSLGSARGLLQDHDEGGPKSPLREHMEGMEEQMNLLRRSVRKESSRPDALAQVAEVERLTVLAKSLEPPMLAQVPEADRAAFLRDYRKGMVELLAELCLLEQAILDGDTTKATEEVRVIKELQSGGHERFMPDED